MKKKLIAILVAIVVMITTVFTCVSCSTGIFEIDEDRDYHQVVATVTYKGISKDIYKGQLNNYVASYGATYMQYYSMTVEEVVEYFYNSLTRNALLTLYAKSYIKENPDQFAGIDLSKSLSDLNKDPSAFLTLSEYVYAVDSSNSDLQDSFDSIYDELYAEKKNSKEEEETESGAESGTTTTDEELAARTVRSYSDSSASSYDENAVATAVATIYGPEYKNIKYKDITADFVTTTLSTTVDQFKNDILFLNQIDKKISAETDSDLRGILKSAKKKLVDNVADSHMSVDEFLTIQIDAVILNKYQTKMKETEGFTEADYQAKIDKLYNDNKTTAIKSYSKASDYKSALENGTWTLANASNAYVGVKSILLKFSDEQTNALNAIKSMYNGDDEKIAAARDAMALGETNEAVALLLKDNKGITVNVSNPLYNADEDELADAYTDKDQSYLSVIYAMADSIQAITDEIVAKYEASEAYTQLDAEKKTVALEIVKHNAKVEAFTQWLYLVNDDSGMFSSDSYLVTPEGEDTSYVAEYTVLARVLAGVGLDATAAPLNGSSEVKAVSYDGTTEVLKVTGTDATLYNYKATSKTTSSELSASIYTVVTESGNQISFIVNDYGIHIVMVTKTYGCSDFVADAVDYDADSEVYLYNKNYIYDQGCSIKYDYTYTKMTDADKAAADLDNGEFYVWKAGSFEKADIAEFKSGVDYYTRVWELQNVTCDYTTYNTTLFNTVIGYVTSDNLAVQQIELLFTEIDESETHKYISKATKVYDKYIKDLNKAQA